MNHAERAIDETAWDDRIRAHHAALRAHPLTQQLFVEFHRTMRRLDLKYLSGRGLRLELGSGVYPVKITYPDVIATDVVPAPLADRVLDAEAMDLPDKSVRCVYGQFVFHHLAHPERFLAELQRVCVPGGGAVLLEPAYGWAAGAVFKRLFKTEGFDRGMPGWNAPISDQMTGANQALSGIVFQRDRDRFARDFPDLEVAYYDASTTYLRYVASGGLNFPQLIPTRAAPVLALIERAVSPARRHLALHQFIVVRKK